MHVSIKSKRWIKSDGAWVVDILSHEHQIASDFSLREPISEKEQKDIRWYIEKFAQETPYSVTRAALAKTAIRAYARQLRDQLPAQQFLVSDNPTEQLVIEIIDNDVEDTTNTIHRLQWELLEDPSIWPAAYTAVTVRRSTLESNTDTPGRNLVLTWPQVNNANAPRTINVLVIIARNLCPNSAQYNDIQPFMSLEILANMRDELQKRKRSVKLNIQVARPGTFAAFAAHLENARRRYGAGYFHLVHLDTHGVVKQGSAYLYFNAPSGNGVEGVAASLVAELLHRFEIPYVVLNACESARPNSGNNANIARVFRSQGVKEVLAMSFKVSSDAAKIYLHEFYRQLLRLQVSFATAASIARRVLYKSPVRAARFGLTRELVDWFVPVVYGSANESALLQPDDQEVDEAEDGVDESQSIPWTDACLGRDFDLLRLERLLISEGVVFLTGPAGVGKTCLLDYARKIWGETSLVDTIVHVDFSNFGLECRDGLLEVLLEQTVGVGAPIRSCATANEGDYGLRALGEYLESQSVIFVFDGLQHSHLMLGTERNISKTFVHGGINDVLRQLVSYASPLRANPCYILFTDRRDTYLFLDKQFDYKFEESDNVYRLKGLELADAIELSHRVLQINGEDRAKLDKTTIDQLELVIGALEGIPDCLRTILPVRQTLGIPWSSFHEFLLYGTAKLTESCLPSSGPVLWKEISAKKGSSSTSLFASMMLLGLYWHDGPDFERMMEYIEKSGIGSTPDVSRAAYTSALDMGLIALSEESGTWVHPGFTVYARSPFVWGDSRLSIMPEPPEFLLGLVNGIRQLTLTPLHRATRLAEAMLSPEPNTIAPAEGELAFITNWMAERQLTLGTRMIADVVMGGDYRDMRGKYAKNHRNLLCAIHICLTAGSAIPLEEWPIQLFQIGSSHVRMICTTAEATVFAESFGRLASHLMERLGGLEVPKVWQSFVLVILSYLAATYHSDILLPKERSGEYVDLALAVIEASEAKFGPITDVMTIYARGFPFRYKALQCLDARDLEGIHKFWKLSDDNDRSFIAAMETAQRPSPDLAQQSLPDTSDIKQKIELKLKDFSISKAFIEARKEAFGDMIKAIIQEMQSGGSRNPQQAQYEQEYLSTRGLKHIHDTLHDFGFTGLQAQARWWPESFDVALEMKRSNQAEHKLLELESATDAGNTAEALRHHRALFVKSMERGDIDEALEHVSAVRELHTRDPLLASELPGIDAHWRILKSMQNFISSLTAAAESSAVSSSAQTKFMDNMLDGLKAQGASADIIRAVELGRNLSADVVIQHPAGFATELKTMTKKAMKVIIRNSWDPKFMEKFAQFCLEMQLGNQKVHLAWKSQDYDTLFMVFAEQREMARTELGAALMDLSDIQKDSDRAVWWKNWKQMLVKWGACMNADPSDFEGALARLNEFVANESIVAIETPDDAKELLKNTISTTERLYVNNESALAGNELLKNQMAALERLDKLLSKLECGSIKYLTAEELAGMLSDVKCKRLMVFAYEAMGQNRWAQAKTHIDAAVQLKRSAGNASVDDLQDLVESCEFHLANHALMCADYEFRFEDAITHVTELEALAEKQRRTPEIRRVICPMITRERLQKIRDQLVMKSRLMTMLGAEAGKRAIQEMRAAMGTQYPDEVTKK